MPTHLAEAITKLRELIANHHSSSLRVPVDGDLEVLDWLRAQPLQSGLPRAFFESRDRDYAIAGLGAARIVRLAAPCTAVELRRTLDHIESQARVEGPWLTGVRFAYDRQPEAEWKPFGALWCLLPAVCLERQDGVCQLGANLGGGRQIVERILRDLNDEVTPPPAPDDRLSGAAEHLPERQAWMASVDKVNAALGEPTLGKVVLARRTTLTFPSPVAANHLLSQLLADAARGFGFLLDTGCGNTFVGVAPELLLRYERRHIVTEALAGTRPRGATFAEDERLRGELLAAGKDRREHGHVQRFIEQALREEGLTPHCDPLPHVVTLTHVHHLCTTICAARQGASLGALVTRIHPSPAVCGTPRAAAKLSIEELEPFDRGLYAGVVGVIADQQSELCVAIRSARVQGCRVDIFAGAGLVPGSQPQAEWAELDAKTAGIMRLLLGGESAA